MIKMEGLDAIEKGGYLLMTIVVIGVVLVILVGVTYTNFANNQVNIGTIVTCVGVPQVNGNTVCSTNPQNVLFANAINAGAYKNYSSTGSTIANTGGTNANYVYYILFAALIIGVVIGVLVGVAKSKA